MFYEKRVYVIDITFCINESIFSGNEQQKVYRDYGNCANESLCSTIDCP